MSNKKQLDKGTNSVFKTLGSSHHTLEDRQENDYYATDPKAINLLLDIVKFNKSVQILEPSCGEGHLSKELILNGFDVISTDLIDRGFGGVKDFFSLDKFNGNIITNPPYGLAKEFVEHSIKIIPIGCKIAMFLKLTFMEGKGRKKFFIDNPPKEIWVSSSRINCAKNGDFKGMIETGGSAVAYAWYIWEKGFSGTTSIKWFN